ncbi:2-keto-4-pentenoate hydratase [Alteribacillus bidgolensis]|uniref:2-keto-4-pentenoate hydratase n=1 Tax=Alteribacillus bidgolensis TaxID=930129 RepID=A0A1G8KVR9_9BACI|nr:fumarylacetoacetate hydrolase family protein [Alteribacillus bidgolensis]SDI47463.1 2-keto-4-pentenoate hydratase [Alteribacillus bidgolensis]
MNEKVIPLSEHLTEAEETGQGVEPLTSLNPELGIKQAYQIQLTNIQNKVTAGDKIVGKKIGLTSKAMQDLLGVGEPDYGHLLNSMQVENKGSVTKEKVLQPKVEGEIAFVLKEELRGPDVTTEDVLKATDYIVPALEIVDSRISDWKITLADTIADNASSGLFVLGDKKVNIKDIDLKNEEMILYKNSVEVNKGKGSAALEDPAYCVAWLANKLFEYDITLKAGEVILSGALSAAVDASSRDTFKASFPVLGEVEVSFK